MRRKTGSALALLSAALLAACGGGGGGGGGTPADTTPPTVAGSTPAPAATGVPAGSGLSVQFSEPMNAGTVAVLLTPAVALGAPAWSGGGTVVTFTPTSPLVLDRSYAVAVSGQDLAGNPLAATGWSFTTAPASIANIWDAVTWDQGTWQ